MERNTILAILLSAVVLFGYQAFFPDPYLKSKKELPTAIAKQEATLTNNLIENKRNLEKIEKPKSFEIIKPKTSVSFSTIGGSIEKIKFLQNIIFPIDNILLINGLQNSAHKIKIVDNNTVIFSYQDKNWQINKFFTMEDKNLLKIRMEIKNVSESSILNNLSFTAFQINDENPNQNSDNRETALDEYSVNANHKIFRKGNAVKFNDKNYKNELAKISWVGFRDHYHALVIKPEFDTKAYEIKADNEKSLHININPEDKNVASGESLVYDFSIYVGPQNPWAMKKYGKEFEKIVAFSNFPPIEWIGQAIYHVIPFFHKIFKSWGLSIILVSILIYGITYPMTMQSMLSMRKMQEVQPKIKALQERFKNDPQKLNAEMIEIYRREKINPLGGCLPFLIQMPFFMALYQILWRAQYFQSQGFLWIKDLTLPDRLIIFPYNLPIIGNELNILPVLTGIIMFFQQKISSKNMVVADEQQAMQQKMMMYILPVMMTFMFYKFASSWAVYFFVFYVLSTATQWKISKYSVKK